MDELETKLPKGWSPNLGWVHVSCFWTELRGRGLLASASIFSLDNQHRSIDPSYRRETQFALGVLNLGRKSLLNRSLRVQNFGRNIRFSPRKIPPFKKSIRAGQNLFHGCVAAQILKSRALGIGKVREFFSENRRWNTEGGGRTRANCSQVIHRWPFFGVHPSGVQQCANDRRCRSRWSWQKIDSPFGLRKLLHPDDGSIPKKTAEQVNCERV